MSSFIDAHCHLADPAYEKEPGLQTILQQCQERQLTGFVQGGVDPEDWSRQLEIAKRFHGLAHIFPVFGLHPWKAAEFEENEANEALLKLSRIIDQAVALGETGLDFGKRFATATHARQVRIFEEQLKIADQAKKPLVLHIVRAHSEAIKILSAHRSILHGGIVHFFSGDKAAAKKYLELGFSISLRAPLSSNSRRALSAIPVEKLVLESDAPDAELSTPLTIFKTAEAISGEINVSAEKLLWNSNENLKRVFGLLLPTY